MYVMCLESNKGCWACPEQLVIELTGVINERLEDPAKDDMANKLLL